MTAVFEDWKENCPWNHGGRCAALKGNEDDVCKNDNCAPLFWADAISFENDPDVN